MTREEKQKAIDALKKSAPIMAVTQEEFKDYIQTINKTMGWLEQEPCEDRMKYVQETVNTIMNSCKTDSIKDKCFRNAARFIQNAIDGSSPEFELIKDAEPCEDVISRQAVLDLVCADWKYEGLEEPINSLPPVTPQSKTGHWINIDTTHSKCDRCGAIFEIASSNGEINFCPNCSAKMVEPQESEDKACKDCYYNDREVHAECVICDKAESEGEK